MPIEEDPQQLDNPCVIHDTGSIIFLHDPFEMDEDQKESKVLTM